jgi:hypothetical protein
MYEIYSEHEETPTIQDWNKPSRQLKSGYFTHFTGIMENISDCTLLKRHFCSPQVILQSKKKV